MKMRSKILSVFILFFVVAVGESRAGTIDERKFDIWKRTCEVAIQNYHDGHFAESESYFEKALVEIRKVAPDSNQELLTLARLADISLRRKNGKKSDRDFLKVKFLYLKLKADKKLDKEGVAELDRLADSYEKYVTRADERREKCLLTCLELRDIVSGDSHKNMIAVLRKLVVFYIVRRKFEKAEPFATRLVILDQKKFGFETNTVGQELVNLGRIKAALEKYSDAESYFRQALAIFMSKDKVIPNLIPMVKTELALTLLGAKKVKLAVSEAKQSLKMIERNFGAYSKESIKTRQVLAQALQANGNMKEAVKQREIVVGLVNRYFGINNPMNIKDLKELNRYYKNKGNRLKAKKITDEIKVIDSIMKK